MFNFCKIQKIKQFTKRTKLFLYLLNEQTFIESKITVTHEKIRLDFKNQTVT